VGGLAVSAIAGAGKLKTVKEQLEELPEAAWMEVPVVEFGVQFGTRDGTDWAATAAEAAASGEEEANEGRGFVDPDWEVASDAFCAAGADYGPCAEVGDLFGGRREESIGVV